MSLILPADPDFARILGRGIFNLDKYSRRQKIALERPEEHDVFLNFASNEPMKREVEVVNDVQLVSVLTIDLDDKPEWHARVGWMESRGYFVPLRAWQPWMEEPAQRVLDELIALPRDLEPSQIRTAVRTAGRPSTVHKFIRVSPEEREYLQGVRSGIIKPSLWFKEPRRFV